MVIFNSYVSHYQRVSNFRVENHGELAEIYTLKVGKPLIQPTAAHGAHGPRGPQKRGPGARTSVPTRLSHDKPVISHVPIFHITQPWSVLMVY